MTCSMWDMSYLFERYRLPENNIDYLKFIDDVFAHESSASYCNACIIYYIAIARKKEFKILSIEEEIGEIDEPTAEEKAKIDKEYNIWKIGTSIVTIVALGIYLIPIIMN